MNDVAWALQTARQVGPIHPPHAHAHPIHKAHLTHTGPLRSHVAGRTDHLPSQVPNGSFVLPADIVSGLGEGNTEAGFKIAKRMFEGARRHFGGLPYAGENGPYGQGDGLPYAIVRGHAKGGSVADSSTVEPSTVNRAVAGSSPAPSANPQPIEGIMAYHGSPHQFDQFDASKIGTGEGAQAYGHGLYFAQNEGTAKSYRDNLSDRNVFLNGRPHTSENGPEEMAHSHLYNTGDVDAAINSIKQSGHQGFTERHAIKWLRDNRDNLSVTSPGHMYHVRIKAHPEHFLDWDKPLSEQSEHVRRAIDKIASTKLGHAPNYERLAQAESGAGLHSWLSSLSGYHGREGQEGATNEMHAHGIRGIRYLDQGSRVEPNELKTWKQAVEQHTRNGDTKRAEIAKQRVAELEKQAAQGTHNYVVFDPKDIEIVRRYAQGGDVEADQQAVPVAVAGGEHVLAPHEVEFAGMGDTEMGHKALEAFVLRQRAKLIKTLKGLPGPKND